MPDLAAQGLGASSGGRRGNRGGGPLGQAAPPALDPAPCGSAAAQRGASRPAEAAAGAVGFASCNTR